ncbi:UNC93-like protein C922.05c-like protein [Martensiomyces pterosporus]|nr:UNC93-like protein C922.05c-like protein [Martensiomyces pterosporus]
MRFRYHSPMTQVVIMSIVCFLCPGMYNALNAMGGAGQVNRTVSNNTNTGIYCTLIVFGVVGGAIVNLLGIRWTIFISGLTYSLYSSSYIYYNHTGNGAFAIATGPILGIGAGILWSAQGMIMMSYPNESQKGRYISIFWVIFNLGGVIGGIVPFVINYNLGKGTVEKSLPDAGYIVFVILEALGAAAALTLAPPERVIRGDGSHVVLMRYTNVRYEAMEILKLFLNPWILLLIPAFFMSNFFYSYQWGGFNGSIFTLRTRGLNSMLYWGSQMAAAYAISFLHDRASLSRRKRGIISLVAMAVLINVMWGCTLIIQLRYTHGPNDQQRDTDYPGGLIDFTESSRAFGPMILYCFMGIMDAHYQSFVYWLIGTMTNDSQMLARYAGFYKGMQSLGAAIAWQLDAQSVNLLHQLIVNWVLINFGIPFMLYVAVNVKDQSDEVEELPNEDWLIKDDMDINYL